uniref:Uncharacterized protein LOC111125594 isoform X4 n=1 Tax=Crassostrea virginica TaxID=6565 RepID=A0A8B8DB63_CRAVI|nr:uncharacterized protein LOC111125594 isoform X4 [Crassostrea virginica]
MSCNWQNNDYFSLLMSTDKKAHAALEMLVDDLHGDKERTVHKFLGHSGAEDFLYGLVRLLGSDNPRVAGNAAYIIGTVAETEMGCYRILGLAKGQQGERKILADLTRMLTFDDSESVMNAAGTMGTLAESFDGREWILAEPCLSETLDHITTLLQAENLWTASNAALVLARLAISENGCNAILEHENSQHILSKLVQSLGVDEAGRGMNAAFAIGRLCDMEIGRKRLLLLSDSERMLSSLAKMLSCDDTGASKNACFALSCLATNGEGHARLLKNIHSDNILRTLSELLNAEDSETGWFAAMTLRTLASQPKGCLRLRDHPQVIPALQAVDKGPNLNSDLKEEAVITLEILKKLDKPSPPTIEVIGHNSIKASWEEVPTKSGFTVRYQLFDSNNKCVYTGKDLTCQIFGLLPCSQYTYKLRAFTEGDESPFSESVTIVTEENVPTAPTNLRVMGCTITQLKIGWDPPEQVNGTLKGYYIYLDEKMIEHTQELSSILTGLTASTSYNIEVCAATSKGKGDKSYIVGTTSEIGAHAPSKPHVQVLGRNELHVTWEPPEVPLGRITRYDVLMNGKIIYSGTELSYAVRRLTPDTEYSFVVVALTSEGKFDSKATKKRTAKDEYDSSRPPLYQAPTRRDSMGEVSNVSTTVSRKKKSAAVIEPKRQAASGKHRSVTPGNLRSKTPADQATIARPISGSSSASTIPEKESKENRETEHKESTRGTEPQHHIPERIPTKSAPVHAVHFRENHHHQSIQRNPPPKPERFSHVNKMFPLSVSYVSIQGNEGKEKEDKKALYKSGTFIESSNSNSMHGLRVERSRTTMHSSHVKRRSKVIEHNGPINQNLIGQEYLNTLLGKSTDVVPPKQDVQLNLSSHQLDVSKQPAQNEIATRKMSPKLSQSTPKASESVPSAHHPRVKERREKPNRDLYLPKPALPSQQYLEGRAPGLSTPYGSRSLPSPRSLYLQKDGEGPEQEVPQRKSSYGSRNSHLLLAEHPHDCSYFLSMQEHHCHGNVSVHRTYKKTNMKHQSPESIPAMPTVPSAQTFNLDIPENKSTLTTWNRTFIPMQLRTQPSNLPPSQLQRMNTTLGEQAKGVQFKRVEALTRSKTVIDLKQNPPTLAEQAERFPITQSANPKGRSSPHLKGSKGLMRSPSAHYKEPDSMLLKKSWSTHEATQLSAR